MGWTSIPKFFSFGLLIHLYCKSFFRYVSLIPDCLFHFIFLFATVFKKIRAYLLPQTVEIQQQTEQNFYSYSIPYLVPRMRKFSISMELERKLSVFCLLGFVSLFNGPPIFGPSFHFSMYTHGFWYFINSFVPIYTLGFLKQYNSFLK